MARSSDPVAARHEALGIVQTLNGMGHTAYFAGGCVRDELLGIPATDYDVATSATPTQIKQLFGHVHEVGASFGVMLIPRAEGIVIEVATFRADGEYSDKRRPDSVRFADAKTDAQRRDFTINALFLDPLADAEGDEPTSPLGGVIIDYVEGISVLHAGLIRAVGEADARLDEDHLRALRAVRFSARLGLMIEEQTQEAIRRHASRLEGVSRERIGEELRRMLTNRRRADAARLIQSLGLDAPTFQEPTKNAELRTLAGLNKDADFSTSLCAWAIDRHGEMTEQQAHALTGRWRNALCLTNDERDAMNGALASLRAIPTWLTLPIAQQKRIVARPGFWPAMGCLQVIHPIQAGDVRTRVRELETDGIGINPEPILNGDHLIGLGWTPGPRFKGVLDAVYDAQLEGRVRKLEQGMELARRLYV